MERKNKTFRVKKNFTYLQLYITNNKNISVIFRSDKYTPGISNIFKRK